jgi:hypothetical protein
MTPKPRLDQLILTLDWLEVAMSWHCALSNGHAHAQLCIHVGVITIPLKELMLGLQAHTTATQSREFQNFNHDVLMAIGGILQKKGISFA